MSSQSFVRWEKARKSLLIIRSVGRLFHCFLLTKEKDDFPNVVLHCGILHSPLIVDLVARAANSEPSVTKFLRGGGAALCVIKKIRRSLAYAMRFSNIIIQVVSMLFYLL